MYDYELPFSEDANVQKVIEEYLQQQMVRAIERIIDDDEVVRKFRNEEKLTTEEIVLLTDNLREFFPKFYSDYGVPETMRELYFIISSPDRYIPNLVEEYVLAAAIEDRACEIVQNDLLQEEIEPIIPFPMTDDIREILINEFMDSTGADRKESEELVIDRVRSWEDYSGIIEDCFYDTDFAFLDDHTTEDIVRSRLDKDFGIGAIEPARKRLPDGDFEYIHRPVENNIEQIHFNGKGYA